MKKQLSRFTILLVCFLSLFILMGDDCNEHSKSSDGVQQAQQEKLLAEGTAQVGMPSVKNFRERKLLKDIIELRDQESLTTYTYVWNEYKGTWVFFCNSIGYGIPYATQFTNPSKMVPTNCQCGYSVLPQADPNGLFSPASAEGTWVMCKDPNSSNVKPVYIEPRIIVSPFELSSAARDDVKDEPKKK